MAAHLNVRCFCHVAGGHQQPYRKGVNILSKVSGLKSGTQAPRSGQYELVGPRGGRTGQERTVVRGEPMPPTPKPGMSYKLVDPSKNGAGRP